MRIVKSSLHAEVAERIRARIIQGALPPGERISERELCEAFGVSRTPLREALKVLASEGLVDLTPNHGARVVKHGKDDVAAMFQVMAALEALSGELACARITDRQLAEIGALHGQMLVHYNRGDRPEYFRLNLQIHEAIVAAAQNPTLTQMYESLSGRMRRSRYVANTTRKRWSEAVREHERILEALSARDGERLAKILKNHLEHRFEAVCESDAASMDEVRDAGDGTA